MYYIGLDVGTSGCKASVSDGSGNIASFAHRAYGVSSPQPGYVEVDATLVWGKVLEALREAVQGAVQSGIELESFKALAIASFGEAVVLVGEDGEPLEPSIYFSDIRGRDELKDIAELADARAITAITGMPPNPMFSANKLLWIKKHHPETLDKAKYLMLFGDFIGYKLTGERAIDFSLASRTMLFDIDRNKWADGIAGALGLPSDRFSRPVRAGTPVATILPSVADALGLPHSLTIVAGGHDQALAALGSGAIQLGEAIDGMGSAECITVVIDKSGDINRMTKFNFCREPHVVENRFITLAFNASAGTAITWFRDRFFTELKKEAEARGENVYRLMDATCPEEPTDLLLLPYVGGSGTPYLDSAMGGAFIGLTLAAGIPDMYKAVLEGICFECRHNLELLDQIGLAPHEIRVSGGSSQSDTMMQIKADVLGREIKVLNSWDASTVALAWLCAKGMGEESAVLDNARAQTSVSRVYKPDARRAEIYNAKMAQYKKLYPLLKSLSNGG